MKMLVSESVIIDGVLERVHRTVWTINPTNDSLAGETSTSNQKRNPIRTRAY